MLFRQLWDSESSTFTYILGNGGEAIVIDPVLEKLDRDQKLLTELGLKLTHVLETHVHADHVTAAAELRRRTGARVVVSRHAGVKNADVFAREGDTIPLGDISVKVLETPGHTSGCLSFLAGGKAFTGDALMIRTAGRTDFQSGSAERLFESIMKLYALPAETEVYPAHDYAGRTVSTIGEERVHNARIPSTASREAFVQLMNGLKLPEPKKIQIAVPRNLVCGDDA